MEDRDLRLVKKYLDEYLFEPKQVNDIETFEVQSYSRWAAGEIFGRMAEELFKPPPCITGIPSRDPIDIIEEFSFDMESYSERSDDERCKRMFTIARETADDILYFYIQERSKGE